MAERDTPMSAYERHRKRVEAAVGTEYVQIQYDIKEELQGELNPSDHWWRIGFRSTDSVWIIPAGMLYRIQADINAFEAYEVNHHVIVLAAGQKDVVQAMCQKALEEKVAQIQGSLIRAIDDADRKYKEAEAAVEVHGSERAKQVKRLRGRRDSRCRQALKEAGIALNQSIECAMLFDETESVQHLFDALQTVISARAKAFNALAEAEG